jgi:ribosome-binding protein aMBF1 (putative translation factor)
MALIQCRECKAQVSDSATLCPACGAPPPKKTSFFTKFVVGSVVLMAFLSFINSKPTESTTASAQTQTASATKRENQAPPTSPALDCSKNETEILEFIKTQITDSPNKALEVLRPCAKLTNSPAYTTKIAEAEYAVKVNQNKEMQRLLELEKQIKIDAKAEAKIKKSQGITIGMTMEDVVASNWGKPQSINKTTTATTEREQWVYRNRSYLYFKDGVLTTIQN